MTKENHKNYKKSKALFLDSCSRVTLTIVHSAYFYAILRTVYSIFSLKIDESSLICASVIYGCSSSGQAVNKLEKEKKDDLALAEDGRLPPRVFPENPSYRNQAARD